MQIYPIPMVPGPVHVPAEIFQAYQTDFGSGDLETDFVALYNQAEADLQQIMATCNRVTIQSGEGMLALWGALKSCLVPGDRVLAIATGVFGYGIGEMAAAVGAEVQTIGLPYDQTLTDLDQVEEAIRQFKPKMITVVHCETPSGTLNPLAGLGKLKQQLGVPLLYVDAVSSIAGAPVLVDEWNIDLALGGSQKCLSLPPNLAFVAVSPQAWEIIEQVNYPGYDALKPLRHAQRDFAFPYTPYWHAVAALHAATRSILSEGLENVYARHQQAAAYCYRRLEAIGLELLAAAGAVPSPTVSAVKVPAHIPWEKLDAAFRQRGLVVGGSYGPLSGKVFRLGHMGSQANLPLLEQALDVVSEVVGGWK